MRNISKLSYTVWSKVFLRSIFQDRIASNSKWRWPTCWNLNIFTTSLRPSICSHSLLYIYFFYFTTFTWTLDIQGLSQNWCWLSPDGLMTPSIRILTKRTYSVVYYLSNKHPQISVRQIDLELQLVLWKQLHIPLQRIRGARRSGQKNRWSIQCSNKSMGSVYACFHRLHKVTLHSAAPKWTV